MEKLKAYALLEKKKAVIILALVLLLSHGGTPPLLVECMEVAMVVKRRGLWEEEGEGMMVMMEAEMESETSRRQLWAASAQKKYISYEALKGDVVPCSKPGVPYYNCRALPKANPYTRGCSVISACRDSVAP